MDSIYQSPKYSRIVDYINFNNVVTLRSGFLNDMKVDFNTNWYEWKSEGDPIRERAPFYVYWEFPKNLSGKLCIKGKFFIIDENNKFKFFSNKKTKCISISENKKTKVLAFNISTSDQLEVKFNKTSLFKLIETFKIFFSISICILFLKSFFKINYEPIIITLTISLVSFFFIDITRDFRGFFEHKYLYLGAGGDALTYWGFARDMMHSFLKGNIVYAISGSEDIFYYMPGYRYFLFIQSLIFGETQIFGWFFIILTPSIIFFLLRKLTTNFNAHIITFLFTVFFIMNFYRGVFMHGEALAYPIALLSIIYAIKTSDLNNNYKLKNKYILYSCLFMVIGIFCRPNLLVPAFLIHLYLLYKNLNVRSFFSFLLGYLPLLIMPLHNIFYGGKLVLITSSALIPGNMENSFGNWADVFKDIINGNLNTDKVYIFASHFMKYLTGPAVQPLYLLIPIAIILIVWRLIKTFEVKPLDIISKYKGDPFFIIYLFIFGTHFVCWFFKPGGRYAYLAFILTFILIINFVIDFIKENSNKEFDIVKKLNSYFDNEFLKKPKNLKYFILSCGPLGFFPIASGTLCSFVFAIFGYVVNVNYGWVYTFILSILALIFGTYFCFKLKNNISKSDPSWVVIDEAAGQLIVSAFSGLNPLIHFIGFLLFRFFDISKLSLIKKSEKIRFGIGIMADDFLAALVTVLILLCFNLFY